VEACSITGRIKRCERRGKTAAKNIYSPIKMSLPTALVQCENLQARIEAAFGQSTVPNEPKPHLEFLTAPENTREIVQTILPGQGKIKTVNVVYQPEHGIGELEEGVDPNNCTASTKRGEKSEQYTIDESDNVSDSQLIVSNDLIRHCEDNELYIGGVILKLMRNVERGVAKKSAEQAVLLAGNWASDVADVDGDGNLEVKTLFNNGLEMAAFTSEIINTSLLQTGYMTPIIFGGIQLNQYYKRHVAGCCSNAGLDLAAMAAAFGVSNAYDFYIQQALGGQQFNMVTQPGAQQLLAYTLAPWKDGVGSIPIQGANYFKQVLLTPAGVPVDVTIKDDCGNLSIIVTATTKVIGLPNDMFAAGERYEGVTFTNTIEVKNS
jgi:hypothetical protein